MWQLLAQLTRAPAKASSTSLLITKLARIRALHSPSNATNSNLWNYADRMNRPNVREHWRPLRMSLAWSSLFSRHCIEIRDSLHWQMQSRNLHVRAEISRIELGPGCHVFHEAKIEFHIRRYNIDAKVAAISRRRISLLYMSCGVPIRRTSCHAIRSPSLFLKTRNNGNLVSCQLTQSDVDPWPRGVSWRFCR